MRKTELSRLLKLFYTILENTRIFLQSTRKQNNEQSNMRKHDWFKIT